MSYKINITTISKKKMKMKINKKKINITTISKKKMKMKINKKKMKMKKKSKKKMTNKIIHNVFLDIGFKPFSERLDYQENIEHNKAMNPDFKFILWDDERVNEFIKTQPEDIKKIWGEFPSTFYKIDFVRYLILKEYGGIYMDLDTITKIPLSIEDSENITGFWINKKGKFNINNNVIKLNNDLYDELINYAIEQFYYRKKSIPSHWVIRRFLHSVGANMYKRFIKQRFNKGEIEKLNIKYYTLFNDGESEYNSQWLSYGL